MANTAYAIDGFHYCLSCKKVLFDDDEDWPVDEIYESEFPDELVPCQECNEDVFYRGIDYLEDRIQKLRH